MARDVLSDYPVFNEEFKIHTDDSNFRLGALIIQNCKPIAFYSRKITGAQMRYIVIEKELLSIVETLT